jgi:hypothetical protein
MQPLRLGLEHVLDAWYLPGLRVSLDGDSVLELRRMVSSSSVVLHSSSSALMLLWAMPAVCALLKAAFVAFETKS